MGLRRGWLRRTARPRRAWGIALGCLVLLSGVACHVLGPQAPSGPPFPPPILKPEAFRLALQQPPGTPLTGGRLEPAGPELLLSNSPELVRLAGPIGCLFRSRARGGTFRLVAHHQVAPGEGPMRFSIVLSPASGSVALEVGANSVGLPWGPAQARDPDRLRYPLGGSGADASQVGALALHEYLQRRSGPQEAEPARLAMVAAPGSAVIERDVASGDTWSFLGDFSARSPGVAGDTRAPEIDVALYASRQGPPWPGATTLWESGDEGARAAFRLLKGAGPVLPLAAPEDVLPPRSRGRFPHADRRGLLPARLDGVHWVDLAGPLEGPDARSLPGEYEEPGEDASAPNLGNYGVVYELEVELANPKPTPTNAHLVLCAAGGAGTFAVQGERGFLTSTEPVESGGARWLACLPVPAASSARTRITFSLPPGSPGAQRLFIWPDDIPPPLPGGSDRRPGGPVP